MSGLRWSSVAGTCAVFVVVLALGALLGTEWPAPVVATGLLNVESPAPREGHVAIWHTTGHRMIIWGGSGSQGVDGVPWSYSAIRTPPWVPLTVTGVSPGPLSGAAIAYDSVHGQMVVYGGVSNGVSTSDVWTLSLEETPTWQRLAPIGQPPPSRWSASAVFDPELQRVIVFGGATDGSTTNALADTWALTLSDPPAWSRIEPIGEQPGGRIQPTAVYDPEHHQMIVAGGTTTDTQQVWSLSLSGTPTWSRVPATTTFNLYRATGVYDHLNRRIIFALAVQRGVVALSLQDPPSWTRLAGSDLPGSEPRADYGFSTVYDPDHQQVILFGGYFERNLPIQFFNRERVYVDDVWTFGPMTSGCQPQWRQAWPTAEATPLPPPGAHRLRLPVLYQGCAG